MPFPSLLLFRLCPLKSELTEACFQETPMPFADSTSIMVSNGTMMKLSSTFVSVGTLPVGSTWQMLGIPDTHHARPGAGPYEDWAFTSPCYEPRYVNDEPLPGLSEARCSGQWMNNITIYDQLIVPSHLELTSTEAHWPTSQRPCWSWKTGMREHEKLDAWKLESEKREKVK